MERFSTLGFQIASSTKSEPLIVNNFEQVQYENQAELETSSPGVIKVT